jgi:hypothetical protein
MWTLDELFEDTLKEQIGKRNLDETTLKKILVGIPESVPKIVANIAEIILKNLKHNADELLKYRRNQYSGFEKRNHKKWKAAVDLLEMFLVIASEMGAEFNNKYHDESLSKKDYVLHVLIPIHARSCQVGFEILTLIKSGFADGAHARWRTLHENAVVAFMIAKHGQDIAERYYLHDIIESYKAMLEYQRYCEMLSEEPFSSEELEKAKLSRDTLITRFGNSFGGQYGWAARVLEKDRVLFSDLEKESGLEHLRPYYRMASINVHANTKAVNYRLGLVPNSEPVLLIGPTDYGFADPANGAAISLMQVTTALLNTKPSLDHLVRIKILQILSVEIGEEFLKVQRQLEQQIHKESLSN